MKRNSRSAAVLILPLLLLGCQTASLPEAGKPEQGPLVARENGTCTVSSSGLMWQVERSPRFRSLEEARSYAEELELAGYSDWRLPTPFELYDLQFLFDLHQNGDCRMELDGNYWTEEQSGEGGAGSWEISADQCDPARQYYAKTWGYVRAVRP